MTTDVVLASRQTLATHARSFDWAGWFLPATARDDAAVVYAFCRLVDDLADEAPSPIQADEDLYQLRLELLGRAEPRPLVSAVLDLFADHSHGLDAALELMDGVCSDLGEVRVADDRELLRYCYRVASTVGLMMCIVLDVDEPAALPHAIDLGVAMQLTNICRDVKEDAENGRVYLPERRLAAAGTSQADLLAGSADPAAVAAVVTDLLDLADRYYESASHGMRYIPARSRFAILVASRVYRQIGVVLRASGGDALQGRTVVGSVGKLLQTAVALAQGAWLAVRGTVAHDAALHRPLAGLPGVHA